MEVNGKLKDNNEISVTINYKNFKLLTKVEALEILFNEQYKIVQIKFIQISSHSKQLNNKI